MLDLSSFTIDPRLIEETDRNIAHHLSGHLIGLDEHIRDFEACLALKDRNRNESAEFFKTIKSKDSHSPPLNWDSFRLLARWDLIAAQHCSVTIAQTWDRLSAIKTTAQECPSIIKKIDPDKIEAFLKTFSGLFPHRKQVRDGYTHAVDKAFSAEKINENRLIGGPFLSSVLSDDTLIFSINGKEVHLMINNTSLQNLVKVRTMVFEAFDEVRLQPW